MPGSRGEFDRSLEEIEAKVIELFVMIAEDPPQAAQALAGGPAETARLLAEREQVIDALYLEIENLASQEILLQAPVAADLRFLLSVLRITPELERSHDLIMQVAARAGLAAAGGDLTPHSRALAAQMADLASRMWRQAADCWYQRDRATAADLARCGQQLGELHARLAAELTTGPMTARVPASVMPYARRRRIGRLGPGVRGGARAATA
jgi:phosphate transport system protein